MYFMPTKCIIIYISSDVAIVLLCFKKQQLYICQFTLSVQSILGPCVESLYIKVWDFPTSPVPLGLQNQQYNRLVAFQKYSILQFVSGIVCTFCVHYTHMLHVYMNV